MWLTALAPTKGATMPYAVTEDGIRLYYEETGSGTPLIFVHEFAGDHIASVLDHLKIDRAHVVGLSMGGFATLHFGLRHASRALSLCVAGCGYGAELEQKERFRSEAA